MKILKHEENGLSLVVELGGGLWMVCPSHESTPARRPDQGFQNPDIRETFVYVKGHAKTTPPNPLNEIRSGSNKLTHQSTESSFHSAFVQGETFLIIYI